MPILLRLSVTDEESAFDAREIIQRAHMSNAFFFRLRQKSWVPIGGTTQFPAPSSRNASSG